MSIHRSIDLSFVNKCYHDVMDAIVCAYVNVCRWCGGVSEARGDPRAGGDSGWRTQGE